MKNINIICPECGADFYTIIWDKAKRNRGVCPLCNTKQSIKKYKPKKRKYEWNKGKKNTKR